MTVAQHDTSVLVEAVDLGPGVGAWFTGRGSGADPDVGVAGNLSHRRPHQPSRLAADRAAALDAMSLELDQLHLIRQVHGTGVAELGPDDPPGAELGPADVLVTAEVGRAVAVQVADCVPVLLAGSRWVAAAHAGRRGVAGGVIRAAVGAITERGESVGDLRAAIGPAIGGCCYEVPADMRDELGESHPEAVAETTWGTPSLDLPAAVRADLRDAGIGEVVKVGDCTRCDDRWFSHRRDPDTGRQLGVIVRHSS